MLNPFPAVPNEKSPGGYPGPTHGVVFFREQQLLSTVEGGRKKVKVKGER
jgi:hypothetical protein